MSGHSKWHSIKHKKGAIDAKRGKLFTKLGKEITIAAKAGGGDLDGNPRLRTAVANAKANRMPKDNIERAIKRGSGDLDGGQLEEWTFEGYASGGVALIIECVSDNKNRTTSEVKHILSKYGGNLGTTGCVMHQFDRKGVIVLEGEDLNDETIMETGLEVDGFEDVEVEGENAEVTTEPNAVTDVQEALEAAGFTVSEAKVTMMPTMTVKIEGKTANTALKLIDMLEDNDDVQNVYGNYDIDDEEMERLMQG